MAPLSRWTDDRLDDLHKLVTTLDTQVDANTRLVDSHDRDLREIGRTGDRRSSDRRAIYLMLAAILIAQVLQIVDKLAHLG